jgi:tRNA A37 threonylcarbamoyladenosine synthetase subunit TsaC/SUA5/YrdC
MQVRDITGDAQRSFDILRQGGIGILPMDVGYSILGGSGESLRKIFNTKRRASSIEKQATTNDQRPTTNDQ